MKIVYQWHRGNKIVSRMIRLISPNFNHSSIRFVSPSEDVVYEAHGGETIQPKKYRTWKGKSTVVKSIVCYVDEETFNRARAFAKEQEGKTYDWMGIFSYVWRYLKQKKGKWYCSEIQMAIYMRMRHIRMIWNDLHLKVSPDESFKAINLSEKSRLHK